MPKHYHVTNGLRGGYIPNDDRIYSRKVDALADAREQANGYREAGEKILGSAESGYIAREGMFPGEYHDYITVSGPCVDDCETDQDY